MTPLDGDPNMGELLARLAAQFEGLGGTSEGDPAHALLVDGVRGTLAELEHALSFPARDHIEAPPPRRVAVALALAIFSQPHLNTTLLLLGDEAERERPHGDDPLLFANDILEKSLGLTQWELDDLRDEVDRRAGALLKQSRVLEWTWGHFGLPDGNPFSLFRVLFPGASSQLREVDLMRRGAQLYAVVHQEPVLPVDSLYLGWLDYDAERTYPPLSTFRARYVDVGLRRALARSIGADDDEIDELLDSMVTIVPGGDAEGFVQHDAWRWSGFAAMTCLGRPYTHGHWLGGEVRAEDLDVATWLRSDDAGGVRVEGQVNAHFDGLAVPRIQAMMQQIYAAMIATIHRDVTEPFAPAIFDTHRNLRAVLDPLIAAVERIDGRQAIAQELGVAREAVEPVLDGVAESWRRHAEAAWLGEGGSRYALAPILTAHLIALGSSLRKLYARDPVLPWAHREVLLLFTAHYLAEARLERLWLRGLSDSIVSERASLPPPEDIPGTWFWASWQRLLATLTATSNATLSF